MQTGHIASSFARSRLENAFSPLVVIAVLIGIIMPLVSAAIYPTYVHTMQREWIEWSRLLEFPFVVSETIVICWAVQKGMDSTEIWRSLPIDMRVASIMLTAGMLISSLFISAEPLRSLTISIIYFIHGSFAFAVFYLLRQPAATDVSVFLRLLGAGLLALAVLTLWVFALPPSLADVPGGVIEWHAALPGFINVRHFGSWAGAIGAGFMAILLYRTDKNNLSWMHCCFVLAMAMTVWSGTRAAVLAISVTGLILILLNKKMPKFRDLAILAMLTGIAATIAWLLIPYNDPSFMLFASEDAGSANQLTGGRLELWAATLHKWQESALFGWGSGSQFWEVFVGWRHTQPHNAILQFLISWGLVGTFGAIWLLGRTIHAAHMATIRNAPLQPLLAILYTLLLMSLLEGMLHYPRFIMLIVMIFAAIFAFDLASRERQRQN